MSGAARLRLSEAQDEHQGFVDGAKFIRVEAAGGSAESLGVDDGGLLDQDACLVALKCDGWAEARWSGACRGGETRTVLSSRNWSALDDDGEAGAACSCPRAPRAAGRWKISPRTISVRLETACYTPQR